METNPEFESESESIDLEIEYGDDVFPVHLNNSKGVNVADLAEAVLLKTGLPENHQRLIYKGLVFDPPDTSEWSPKLDDLNVKAGERVQVMTSSRASKDQQQDERLQEMDTQVQEMTSEIEEFESQYETLQRGYHGLGDEIKALGLLKKQFENLKSKLMYEIQAANKLKFDHRNALFQAKRREVMDNAQRSMDKCTEMTSCIFHKLAQSQYLGNGGSLFP